MYACDSLVDLLLAVEEVHLLDKSSVMDSLDIAARRKHTEILVRLLNDHRVPLDAHLLWDVGKTYPIFQFILTRRPTDVELVVWLSSSSGSDLLLALDSVLLNKNVLHPSIMFTVYRALL